MTPEIVVGVDGSPNSLAALRWARAEALRRDAHVIALFGWEFIPPGHAGDGHTFDTTYRSSEAHVALAAAVETAVGADATAAIEGCVVYEVAPRALLGLAARAELLVVGARGVGGFGGLRLGSVSEQCRHHTSVPLVIARSDAIAGGLRRDARIVVGVDGSESAQRAVSWAIDEARLRGARLEAVRAWSSLYPWPPPPPGCRPCATPSRPRPGCSSTARWRGRHRRAGHSRQHACRPRRRRTGDPRRRPGCGPRRAGVARPRRVCRLFPGVGDAPRRPPQPMPPGGRAVTGPASPAPATYGRRAGRMLLHASGRS